MYLKLRYIRITSGILQNSKSYKMKEKGLGEVRKINICGILLSCSSVQITRSLYYTVVVVKVLV